MAFRDSTRANGRSVCGAIMGVFFWLIATAAPAWATAGFTEPAHPSFSAAIEPAPTPCGTVPLDVVLVIDRSGSMGETDTASGAPRRIRSFYAKAAAVALVDTLDAHGGVGGTGLHRVGLSSYGDNIATVNLALGASSAETVNAAINGLVTNGNTPFRQGMAAGAGDMLAHERGLVNGLQVRQVIIFLSDGRPSPDDTSATGSRPTALNTDDFKAAADIIFSVGVGTGGTGQSQVDPALMASLAEPVGNYTQVTTGDQLVALFADIVMEILCPSPAPSPTPTPGAIPAPGATGNSSAGGPTVPGSSPGSDPVSQGGGPPPGSGSVEAVPGEALPGAVLPGEAGPGGVDGASSGPSQGGPAADSAADARAPGGEAPPVGASAAAGASTSGASDSGQSRSQKALEAGLPGPFGSGSFGGPGRLAPSATVLSTGTTLVLAFLLIRRKRLNEAPTGSDAELAAAAASPYDIPSIELPLPATGVDPGTGGTDVELPRWRRPSLLAARKSDPMRNGAEHVSLTFEAESLPRTGAERQVVRYRLVRLRDRPDEVLGQELDIVDEGDEVEILERHGTYRLVVTPDGRRGWLHRMTLGGIVSGGPGAVSGAVTATNGLDGVGSLA